MGVKCHIAVQSNSNIFYSVWKSYTLIFIYHAIDEDFNQWYQRAWPSNLDSTDPDLFDGNPETPLMYVVFVTTTMLFTGISAVMFL